jgi:hypothetical protein
MFLTPAFFEAVRPLLVPEMGTDLMAPLLYTLIRFTRARTVLEGGAGYTSVFLAQALKDNALAFEQERAAVLDKTRRFVADFDALAPPASSPAPSAVPREPSLGFEGIYSATSPLAKRRLDWLREPPAWARPPWYAAARAPRLFCIDDASYARSSATRVRAKLAELDLADVVSFHDGEFWAYDLEKLPSEFVPLDLIWVDVPVSLKSARSLLSGPHWQKLNPNGGLLVVHDLLTTRGGQLLADAFKSAQRERGDFEIVGLLEPQRLAQGDFVLIRRTTGARVDPIDEAVSADDASTLEHAARALLPK